MVVDQHLWLIVIVIVISNQRLTSALRSNKETLNFEAFMNLKYAAFITETPEISGKASKLKIDDQQWKVSINCCLPLATWVVENFLHEIATYSTFAKGATQSECECPVQSSGETQFVVMCMRSNKNKSPTASANDFWVELLWRLTNSFTLYYVPSTRRKKIRNAIIK